MTLFFSVRICRAWSSSSLLALRMVYNHAFYLCGSLILSSSQLFNVLKMSHTPRRKLLTGEEVSLCAIPCFPHLWVSLFLPLNVSRLGRHKGVFLIGKQ